MEAVEVAVCEAWLVEVNERRGRSCDLQTAKIATLHNVAGKSVTVTIGVSGSPHTLATTGVVIMLVHPSSEADENPLVYVNTCFAIAL